MSASLLVVVIIYSPRFHFDISHKIIRTKYCFREITAFCAYRTVNQLEGFAEPQDNYNICYFFCTKTV